jgi:hypothetical protein
MVLLKTFDQLLGKNIEVLTIEYICNIHALNLSKGLIYGADSQGDGAGKKAIEVLEKINYIRTKSSEFRSP